MKNAFIAMIVDTKVLVLSAGYTSIKSGKGLAMPKTIFTCFYPTRFESPVLHKLTTDDQGTNNAMMIKRPDTAKLIECTNGKDLVETLEKEEDIKAAMKNFVVIPPGLVGSIVGVGTEKPQLDLLLALLREIKDMGNTGSRTRHKVFPKPLEDIISFFVGQAKHELSLLDQLPSSVKLDRTNQGELRAYNKEVHALLETAELEEEEESEDEVELPSEHTSRTKSKKRSRGDETIKSNDIEDKETPEKLQPETNLSLKKQEKIAMIELLTRLSKNAATREAAKSRMKWENWTEASQKTVLALLSKDYEEEPSRLPPRLKEILQLLSGSTVVDLFNATRHNLNCRPDTAMFHHFKIGKIAGESTNITVLTGPTIFSCPVQITAVDATYTDARMDFASMGMNTDNLSKEEIKSLTVQKLNIPRDLSELITMVENFTGVWDFLLERESCKPMFVQQLKGLNRQMKNKAAAIRGIYRDHKQNFINAMMVIIHKKTTLAIKKASVYGVKGLKDSNGVRFDDIFESIEDGTFMNRYQVKLPNDNNDKTENNNSYNNRHDNNSDNNATNNNNRDNYFLPGRQYRAGGNGQFNSPHARGDMDHNQNYNKMKWTQNFGAVLCPETMKAVGDKGKYIPKIKGVNLCLRFHAKGQCFKNCSRAVAHVRLHGRTKQLYDEYSHTIHDKAEKQGRIKIRRNGKN